MNFCSQGLLLQQAEAFLALEWLLHRGYRIRCVPPTLSLSFGFGMGGRTPRNSFKRRLGR